MIILGIDPGTERTGYGIIQAQSASAFTCVSYGCITTPRSKAKEQRLVLLERELRGILKEYTPSAVVVESLFFFKNLKTIMPVSEARGVILLTIAKNKIPLYELSPLQVKMSITGYGRAEKKQVQHMVKETLHLEKIPEPDDAADGLALAIAGSLSLFRK